MIAQLTAPALQRVAIPGTAYGLHQWQLDAWDAQTHPSFVCVAIYRGAIGNYDGWIMPRESGRLDPADRMICSAYICGWLNGRDSKP